MEQNKLPISDIIGESQTKSLLKQSTLLDRKLTAILVKGAGAGLSAKFKTGDNCFDIITYKHAMPCNIMDSWQENGWHKYLVVNDGKQWIVRECDLVYQNK